MAGSTYAPGRFCWFECGSRDAAQARSFYTQLFGWQTAESLMPEGMGTYTLFKVADEDVAGLYEMTGPRFEGVPSHWAGYVAVEDVDDAARRAVALGGRIVLEPVDVPGVGRIAYLGDPTGAGIGIAAFDQHPGTSHHGPFGWCELTTPDPVRARAFYTELFGWTAEPDAQPAYTEFRSGGRAIAGMMQAREPGIPPHWLPYVRVEDCEHIASRSKVLGGRTLVPPTTIENVGRCTVFADPTGAALAAIQFTHR